MKKYISIICFVFPKFDPPIFLNLRNKQLIIIFLLISNKQIVTFTLNSWMHMLCQAHKKGKNSKSEELVLTFSNPVNCA